MKYFVAGMLLALTATIFGQAAKNRPCSQNLKTVKIRGFALGNTKGSIDSQLKPVWEAQKNGTEKAKVISFADKERFAGVRSSEFSVFESVLYAITIIYDSSVRLDNIGTFADEIAKSWKVREKWTGEGVVQLIECKERIAIVTSMRDLTIADNLIQKKIEKKERASERPFKP